MHRWKKNPFVGVQLNQGNPKRGRRQRVLLGSSEQRWDLRGCNGGALRSEVVGFERKGGPRKKGKSLRILMGGVNEEKVR